MRESFGIDDAAGIVVGGLVGTGVYAFESEITHQPITSGGRLVVPDLVKFMQLT
jgi:hypothetical protein